MRCPYCGLENIPGIEQCENCSAELAGLDLPENAAGFRGRMLRDTVRGLTLAPALTVSASDTVASCMATMKEARHGCVLVTDGPQLVGIFTERDVLARVVTAGLDSETTEVAEVMTNRPVTLDPDDPPAYAIHRVVAGGFRHLPVVDGNEILGFISVRNLLRYIHDDVMARAA